MSGKQMAQVAAKVLTAKAAGIAEAVSKKTKLPELPPASWDSHQVLVEMKFGDLVEKRTKLKDEMEFRKAKIEEIDIELQALFMIAGTEKVTWEDRPVQIVHSKSGDQISPEKLLMAGVPAETIADCTEEGKPYQYVLVGKPKK